MSHITKSGEIPSHLLKAKDPDQWFWECSCGEASNGYFSKLKAEHGARIHRFVKGESK